MTPLWNNCVGTLKLLMHVVYTDTIIIREKKRLFILRREVPLLYCIICIVSLWTERNVLCVYEYDRFFFFNTIILLVDRARHIIISWIIIVDWHR